MANSDQTPACWIPFDEIEAVFWDIKERPDPEGDYEYKVLVGGNFLTTYRKLDAKDFCKWLFDYKDPARDWQERLATDPTVTRIDFATNNEWRCRLKFFLDQEILHSIECGVALVPSYVQAVIGHPDRSSCAVLLHGTEFPVTIQLGSMTARQFSKCLFAPKPKT